GGDLGPLAAGVADQVADPVELHLVAERAELGILVPPVAELRRPAPAAQPLAEIAGQPPGPEAPLAPPPTLPPVAEPLAVPPPAPSPSSRSPARLAGSSPPRPGLPRGGWGPARGATGWPVGMEPVKLTIRGTGWTVIPPPTSSLPLTTLRTPAGRMSRASSP